MTADGGLPFAAPRAKTETTEQNVILNIAHFKKWMAKSVLCDTKESQVGFCFIGLF